MPSHTSMRVNLYFETFKCNSAKKRKEKDADVGVM